MIDLKYMNVENVIEQIEYQTVKVAETSQIPKSFETKSRPITFVVVSASMAK